MMARPAPVLLARVRRYPWSRRIVAVRDRLVPWLPVPIRLPFGAVWLAWGDAVSRSVARGLMEPREQDFVGRLLRDGMTVLDVGAHHGLYTLLAARRVGPTGRVLSVEPSPRERRRLAFHLFLNRTRNTEIASVALGDREGRGELFVAGGGQSGFSSLRPPVESRPSTRVVVPLLPLDTLLARRSIGRVDFMKIDVEGAELLVLRGAARLLGRADRPVLLCEVDDRRTAPFGYPAREIWRFLAARGYRWFRFSPRGGLEPCPSAETFGENLVASPDDPERVAEVMAAAGVGG